MKTLFEKLKPEVLKSLEREASLYPSTIERLIDTLKSVTYYGQLSISDAHRLISLEKSFVKFDIEILSNLFDE
jgi:predicted ATPase